MTLEIVIVAVAVLAAVIYYGHTILKKLQILKSGGTGPCGHRCDCCPFGGHCASDKNPPHKPE